MLVCSLHLLLGLLGKLWLRLVMGACTSTVHVTGQVHQQGSKAT